MQIIIGVKQNECLSVSTRSGVYWTTGDIKKEHFEPSFNADPSKLNLAIPVKHFDWLRHLFLDRTHTKVDN